MTKALTVQDLLASVAEIGRDPVSGGYNRFAYSAADDQLRSVFAEIAAELGLTVSVDRAHNQWAWWGDPDESPADNVVLGSHLDSVPAGGPLDGPLGVFSALAAVSYLRAAGFSPRAGIGVVNFSDEEGARFGVACLGSRVLTGETTQERLGELVDPEGIGFRDVVAGCGLDPASFTRDDHVLGRIGRFLELHVEQGHQLVELGAPIGLASYIWPHGRWSTTLRGVPNHAGTTKLVERDDPMQKAAHLLIGINELAIAHDAIATCGKVLVEPNAINAIAAAVHLWIDARADQPDRLVTLEREMARLVEGFGGVLVNESLTPMTTFSEPLTRELGQLLGGPPVISTGAGHDAGILASHGISAAMIFVRNPTGVSHAPNESASPEDMEAGVEALVTVLRGLAE